MSIVRNYRNAKLLLNAARKSRRRWASSATSTSARRARATERRRVRWRERCSVAIRSLSFALQGRGCPQPRLFTVVNNVAYGYPLEEDPRLDRESAVERPGRRVVQRPDGTAGGQSSRQRQLQRGGPGRQNAAACAKLARALQRGDPFAVFRSQGRGCPAAAAVVNNVAYGYPLEEDPLGLIVKARWNDRVAELYSALTEQPAANHPLDIAPTPRQRWRLSACRRWRIHGRDRGGRCWRCVPRRSIIWPGCAPMTGWIWRAPSMRWTSPTRCRPS